MSSLRLLVVEGNVRPARERHRATYGLTPSESYAAVLKTLAPEAICDIAFPADEGANLPEASGLAEYDGVVITGSALNIWKAEPESMRQVELAREVYKSGTPFFGSAGNFGSIAYTLKFSSPPESCAYTMYFESRLQK